MSLMSGNFKFNFGIRGVGLERFRQGLVSQLRIRVHVYVGTVSESEISLTIRRNGPIVYLVNTHGMHFRDFRVDILIFLSCCGVRYGRLLFHVGEGLAVILLRHKIFHTLQFHRVKANFTSMHNSILLIRLLRVLGIGEILIVNMSEL